MSLPTVSGTVFLHGFDVKGFLSDPLLDLFRGLVKQGNCTGSYCGSFRGLPFHIPYSVVSQSANVPGGGCPPEGLEV